MAYSNVETGWNSCYVSSLIDFHEQSNHGDTIRALILDIFKG
jgi:hypothetical protein